jgi:hypothetical protein
MLIRHQHYIGESIESGNNNVHYEEVTDLTPNYDDAEGIFNRLHEVLEECNAAAGGPSTKKEANLTTVPTPPTTVTIYTVVTEYASTTLLTYDEFKEFISGFTGEYMESDVVVLESEVDPSVYDKLSRIRGAAS